MIINVVVSPICTIKISLVSFNEIDKFNEQKISNHNYSEKQTIHKLFPWKFFLSHIVAMLLKLLVIVSRINPVIP